MYLLNLTKEERNNLLSFLSRLDLKGNEAFLFCDLVHKIQKLDEQKEGEKVEKTN